MKYWEMGTRAFNAYKTKETWYAWGWLVEWVRCQEVAYASGGLAEARKKTFEYFAKPFVREHECGKGLNVNAAYLNKFLAYLTAHKNLPAREKVLAGLHRIKRKGERYALFQASQRIPQPCPYVSHNGGPKLLRRGSGDCPNRPDALMPPSGGSPSRARTNGRACNRKRRDGRREPHGAIRNSGRLDNRGALPKRGVMLGIQRRRLGIQAPRPLSQCIKEPSWLIASQSDWAMPAPKLSLKQWGALHTSYSAHIQWKNVAPLSESFLIGGPEGEKGFPVKFEELP